MSEQVALETEVTNNAAMKLYESLGFLRSKLLHRYYLNGNSAYRLLLYLKPGVALIPTDYGSYEDYAPEQEAPTLNEGGTELLGQHII